MAVVEDAWPLDSLPLPNSFYPSIGQTKEIRYFNQNQRDRSITVDGFCFYFRGQEREKYHPPSLLPCRAPPLPFFFFADSGGAPLPTTAEATATKEKARNYIHHKPQRTNESGEVSGRRDSATEDIRRGRERERENARERQSCSTETQRSTI